MSDVKSGTPIAADTAPSPDRVGSAVPAAPGGWAAEFPRVVARFEGPLLRYATHLMGAAGDEVQDVVQEAFLRLYRHTSPSGTGASESAAIGDLSAWLFRVTHNLAMDALRRRKRDSDAHDRLARDAAEAISEVDTAVDLEQQEAGDRAMKMLGNLPDEQRRVILLKLVQNLTLRQIGEVLGYSHGAVAYQLNQGLAELSRRLRKAGVI